MLQALAPLFIGLAGAAALASLARDLARFPATYARLQEQARHLGVHDHDHAN